MTQQPSTVPNQPQPPYPWWLGSTPRNVRGRELRYLLTTFLMAAPGPMTITELTQAGVEFTSRPSKTISDSLRWEIQWKRVTRIRRGVYTSHHIPRSTKHWIKTRTTYLLAALAKLSNPNTSIGRPSLPTTYIGQTGPLQPPLAPPRQRSTRIKTKLKQVCAR